MPCQILAQVIKPWILIWGPAKIQYSPVLTWPYTCTTKSTSTKFLLMCDISQVAHLKRARLDIHH